MDKVMKAFVSFSIIIVLLISPIAKFVRADDDELTEEQKNAIAYLNYLCYISQDIHDAAHNRVYLEDIYDKLINNTKPEKIDDETQGELASLLDVIQKHQMIDVMRERLKYINELNQSEAIRDALPDPRSVTNKILSSDNYVDLAISVAYLALDSWGGYKNSVSESEREFFEANATLDDEEAEELHERRKSIFMYMINMCKENEIKTSLSEDQIKDFVSIKNETNVTRRIRQLESKRKIYRTFGSYWLLLAESYFEDSEYQKCVDSIEEYRNLNIDIFKFDYDYANVLPKAMAAMKCLCEVGKVTKEEYEQYVLTGCIEIENNTEVEDWALRYFIAQIYVDLYNLTEDESYLYTSYKLCSDTISFLVKEQRKQNDIYLKEIEEIETPKNATKEVKDECKRYNKQLKQNRKTELPPVYEPLLLHCDLMFVVEKKINIDDDERSKMNRILHVNGTPLFLTETLDGLYWFDGKGKTPNINDMVIEYDEDTITMPASCLAQGYKLSVSVSANGKITTFDDWTVDEVDRDKEGDLTTFVAELSSDKADDFDWEGGEIVTITIQPNRLVEDKTYTVKFEAVNTKDHWYKYLKVWESTIVFERKT